MKLKRAIGTALVVVGSILILLGCMMFPALLRGLPIDSMLRDFLAGAILLIVGSALRGEPNGQEAKGKPNN